MPPTFHHPQHKQHKFLLVQIHPYNSEPDFDRYTLEILLLYGPMLKRMFMQNLKNEGRRNLHWHQQALSSSSSPLQTCPSQCNQYNLLHREFEASTAKAKGNSFTEQRDNTTEFLPSPSKEATMYLGNFDWILSSTCR